MTAPQQSRIEWKNVWLALATFTMLIVIVATNFFGLLTPRFAEGKLYEFEMTVKSTLPARDADGNEIAVPARQFMVDQTAMFVAAESSLVEDDMLPDNTFMFRRKIQPALAAGGDIVRGAYSFVEVRYHQTKKEPQTVIPHLKHPSESKQAR